MRMRLPVLQLVLSLTAAAQIGPPSLGVTGGSSRKVVEIQGIPDGWVAHPAIGPDLGAGFNGPVDAAASSSAQLCWTSQGLLCVHNRQSGKLATYPVPEGDARFAFDAKGQLAAAWFLKTGEVYSSAAGWRAVYTTPDGSEPLDVTVAQARMLA